METMCETKRNSSMCRKSIELEEWAKETEMDY
jgi:hypothetical protein